MAIVAGAVNVSVAKGAVMLAVGALPTTVAPAVSVTLSRPMIWSGDVATALSSTQRSRSVAPIFHALLKTTSVGGTVVMPAVLGTTTPVEPLIAGLSAETLVQLAPLSIL